METQKIDVKIFTADGSHPAMSELVPVFHSWIQQRKVQDELLIDVANYAHVPSGPGVMLIGHEGHYALDLSEGKPGLLYSQRRPPAGLDAPQALQRALSHALQACALLEAESALSTPLRFRADRLLVRFNDRLNAPNRASTWELAKPLYQPLFERWLGAHVQLEPTPAGRDLFGFYVVSPLQRLPALVN
jgi:hypothetical protein